MRKALILIFVLVFFSFFAEASANNLDLSDGMLVGQNDSENTIKIQFDVSWDNSWRDSVNYDAAWVFVKFSRDRGTSWEHATLKDYGTNPDGFSAGNATSVDLIVPFDKKGCFIQRSEYGSGTLETSSIKLVWDYGADDVGDADANGANTTIKVFGVEMVHVSEGSFQIGDADADQTGCFKGGNAVNLPASVNSENAITFNGNSNGPYYYQSGGNSGEFSTGYTFTVSSSFPKGYGAFYVMKYEISHGQWIDFFNTLGDTQKIARDITSSNFNGKNSDSVFKRNAVRWLSSGDATMVNGREHDRACNFISWMDLCAYADWAGLRPMTEFEYEKACRGPLSPVDDEYAWGNTTIVAAGTISGTENGTETIATVGANCCYNDGTFNNGDGGKGPLRCGIFATSSSDRTESGAGYYGAMELCGNVWERCVTVGNTQGLNFIGSHGDGTLTDVGNATNSDWPGIDSDVSNGVTGSDGSGFRGGGWYESANGKLSLSNRQWAARSDTSRSNSLLNYWGYGGRCVRTAPE